MRRPLWLVLLTVIVAAASSATRVGAFAAPPDADHARLVAMCGDWNVEMTLWPRPGAPSVAVKGTSSIKPLFDGLFIEEEIQAALSGMAITTLAWTGFNPATRQYEATRIASTNPARIAESGTYDDASHAFELKGEYQLAGETWHQRTVINVATADAMIATSYLAFGTVPEWKAVEIRYARKQGR